MNGFTLAQVDTLDVRVSPKTVWSFVRLRDRDGVEGWGEATMPGIGAPAAVAPVLAELGRALLGRTFAAPIDLSAHLLEPDHPEALVRAAAVSAIDQALWDIAARRAGKPLASLLGTPARDAVELYANINRRTLDRTPQGFAASARGALARGFTAFKIAPFDGVTPDNADGGDGRRLIAEALERAAAVREAIGRDARLMIDCHWRLSEAGALEVIAAARPLDLYWLECALPETRANFAAMRRVRAHANAAGFRTAGCETMIAHAGFKPFLEAELYDAIMPDAKYAGGLVEMLRIAALAHALGVACSPHNPTGPICHAHSLQLATLLQRMPFLEHQFDESPLFVELAAGPPPDFTGPRVSRLAGAGLGIALDTDAAGRHRAEAA